MDQERSGPLLTHLFVHGKAVREEGSTPEQNRGHKGKWAGLP